MKNASVQQFQASSPARLVWLIIIIGCFAGFIMTSIVWWVGVDLRSKREKLTLLSDKLIANSYGMEQESNQVLRQYIKLFNLEYTHNTDLAGRGLLALAEAYEKEANFENITPFFVDLKESIQALQQQKSRCEIWANRQVKNIKEQHLAGKRVDKALTALNDSLQEAHGHRRLDLVLRYKKYMAGTLSNETDSIQQIMEQSICGSGLLGLESEMADLALLVEQLRGETRRDHLVDLKDNRLRTILIRLRRESSLLPSSPDGFRETFMDLLITFEISLLGNNYSFNKDHQTIKIGRDGFCGLVEEHIRLVEEREFHRAIVFTAFRNIHEQLRKTGLEVNKSMQSMADLRENSLQRAWQIMLLVSLLMAAIFLAISSRILAAIRSQIKKIQDANTILSSQTEELTENEEVLREKQDQLEYLSSSLLTAQEDERQRVAYELHDELGQSMTALKLQVRSLVQSMGADPSPILKKKCNRLSRSIKDIIESVRQLSQDLSPAILEDLGIEAALVTLLTTYEDLHEVVIVRDLGPIHLVTNLNSQRNIYRIIQELLTNISKHANCNKIIIRVKKRKRELLVTIIDNGRGFDVDRVEKMEKGQKGMGLSTITERVRIMGGKLEIHSKQGDGVHVMFTVPVS
jgi:signal transduction histidine kinase